MKPTSVDTVADRSFIDTDVLVYAEASQPAPSWIEK
jgi:hypothetical protein